MSQPKVSVLMPIRNGEQYLREAVRSIVDQSFEDWELIAVFDGCTDNSEDVVNQFRDARIRALRLSPPGGFPYALNFGLRQCEGDLIARMDQDDVSERDRLGTQVDVFEKRPALVVLGTSAQLINEMSAPIGHRSVVTGSRRVAMSLLWRNQLVHPSVMFRKSVVIGLGGYDPRSSPIFEDYDLWLRVIGVGEVDNLPAPLLRYRRHGTQQSRGSRLFPGSLATLSRSRHRAGRQLGVPEFLLRLLDAYWFLTQLAHRIVVAGRTPIRQSSTSEKKA